MAESTSRNSKTRGLVVPVEPSAEPFRTLRVALELVPDSRRGNLMLFTSAGPGEGKSTVAANYALVSAVNDRRVLLVDADMRSPTQHDIFGIPRSPGLTEVILSRRELHALTQPIQGIPGLHVLTAGMPAPRAGDIASSSAVRDLLTKASGEYDIVAIDTPPMLVGSDAAHIAAHPDVNVVFVVTKKQGTRRVDRAVAKLHLVGANILGFVVNREGSLSEYGYG
ncbi:MAG: CpsD/CapB family tyrosine-protein kinase [Actinomycetota bacterium]